MSCILVGLSSIKLKPNTLSIPDIAWCTFRDLTLIGLHLTCLVFAIKEQDPNQQNFISEANIIPWLAFDIAIGVLRLVKNPLQFVANRKLEQNGSNWNNPEIVNNWTRFFTPSFVVCQMRIYTLIDWLTYFSWIMGAWAVHPADGSNNLIVFLIYYEITFSTVFYVGSILFYIITYAMYRISKGRCLPGYTINNQDWPSSCPSITFDTSKWKKSDETLAEYRARVVEEFIQEDLVRTQPIQMYQMQSPECRLTREELDGLRTLTFTKTPLQRRNTSKSVISVNRKPSIVRKKSQRSIKVDVEIVQEPSIAVVEARTPLPDDVLAEHERTTDETCALCLEDYAEGDLLRELHCQHRFHAECVDEWLTESKRSCPVCNADATGKPPQEEEQELEEGELPPFGTRVIYSDA